MGEFDFEQSVRKLPENYPKIKEECYLMKHILKRII